MHRGAALPSDAAASGNAANPPHSSPSSTTERGPAPVQAPSADLEALLYAAPSILGLSHRGLLAGRRRRQLSRNESAAACVAGWCAAAYQGPALRLLLLLRVLCSGRLLPRLLLLLLALLCLLPLLCLLALLWPLEEALQCGLLFPCCCCSSCSSCCRAACCC